MPSPDNSNEVPCAQAATDPAPDTADQAASGGPSHRLVLLMAAATGLAVACIYYAQPLLGVLAASEGLDAHSVGYIPTLTTLGYAAGIIFLAPLGDRHERRSIILTKALLLILALLACAFAPNLQMLLAASLAIGITATLAQDIVPAAATLAHEHKRGRVVGTVMTGLLLGILLSRVLSGLVAARFGWRAVFMAAAASMALATYAMWRGLPRIAPTTSQSYRALMHSLLGLLRRHPELRLAATAQGLLALAFSAFWSTLALMLHAPPFHMGSAVAGAYGLAGAAGALAAPFAGHLADRHGPRSVTRFGTAVTTVAFLAMCAITRLSPQLQLWALALATAGFDLGVQSTLIAHQTIIYRIAPEARSRANAVLLGGMFIGMALGAALGSLLLVHFGWLSVTLLASGASLLAFLLRLAGR